MTNTEQHRVFGSQKAGCAPLLSSPMVGKCILLHGGEKPASAVEGRVTNGTRSVTQAPLRVQRIQWQLMGKTARRKTSVVTPPFLCPQGLLSQIVQIKQPSLIGTSLLMTF